MAASLSQIYSPFMSRVHRANDAYIQCALTSQHKLLSHLSLSVSPEIAVWFLVSSLVRCAKECFEKSLRNLHFLPSSLSTTKCMESFSLTCCHAMHEICWWVRKLHMFRCWKFCSLRKGKFLKSFLSLTFLPLHMHMSSLKRTRLTTCGCLRDWKILIFSCAPLATFLSCFFFDSLSLMTLSHIRERKIRGRRSQYLVFCQTWSTHNRDISWKY